MVMPDQAEMQTERGKPVGIRQLMDKEWGEREELQLDMQS
jgi:hypothetical protein